MSPLDPESGGSTEPLLGSGSTSIEEVPIRVKFFRLTPRIFQLLGAICLMIPYANHDKVSFATAEKVLLVVGSSLLLAAQCPPHSFTLCLGHMNLIGAFIGYMNHDFSVKNLLWADEMVLFSGLLLCVGNIFGYAGVVSNYNDKRYISAAAKFFDVFAGILLIVVGMMGVETRRGDGTYNFVEVVDLFFFTTVNYVISSVGSGIGDFYDPNREYYPLYSDEEIKYRYLL